MNELEIGSGAPYPLGATNTENVYNFSIVCKDCISLILCILESHSLHPLAEIPLDPTINRTGDIWHISVSGIPSLVRYAYRVKDCNNVLSHYLLDPYAKEVTTGEKWSPEIDHFGLGNTPYMPIGVLKKDGGAFDWEGDKSPGIELKDLIIYEMHVRGFTRDNSSHVKFPGTYKGIIEKIPHLLELGINAVELLPVYEFNKNEYTKRNPLTKQRLCNYWGYSTVNFFSPMHKYSSNGEHGTGIDEFKNLVKELHKNGIEVILDVVYNHTAEGNTFGPEFSFKGFANSSYYMLDKAGQYLNYSGCGNTFNCNQPITMQLIMDSLHYWVTEMHVDGFRFDLASIFMRGTTGTPLSESPIVMAMSEDPLLANIKLIAEPWDAAGLYHVGGFWPHHPRWSEWNGKYRDSIRKFIKGSPWQKGEFAGRISGSQDLYGQARAPSSSINFITAHDGFTLRDLVSYNQKHNEANGEDNRDGTNDNESWNCGEEGETKNPEVLALRQRQMRNFHLAHMISQGVPMILMGDEYGHTRFGNNNAWCQDNNLNWFLWDQLDQNPDFYRFYRKLIHFRRENALLRRGIFLNEDDIFWHGIKPLDAKWNDDDHFIAFTLYDKVSNEDIYVAFNACEIPQTVTLPTPKGKWVMIVNTGFEPPKDFLDDPLSLETTELQMLPYSAILLKDVKQM